MIVDKYLIPKELKKTSKYNQIDIENVKFEYYALHTPIREIARIIPMSRRMVQFILFPERLALAKKNFALRQKDGRYRYSTKIQTQKVRECRQYKKNIINQLILK